MYKVEHHFVYGWDDAGWQENDRPIRFKTKKEAKAELVWFFRDHNLPAYPNSQGLYDRTDFRVVKADEFQNSDVGE